MPTISAKLIKKSRRFRRCEHCNGFINPGESTVRLYGCAFNEDRPYRAFLCLECADRSLESKVIFAITDLP